MIKKIIELARPEIRSLKPYQSAKLIAEKYNGTIWLDANLNPYPPYPQDGSTKSFNCYAEPQPFELKNKLANIYNVNSDNILITRGSDEAIDLLTRVFCEAIRDAIIICPPTFGMYEISAKIQGAKVIKIPLLDKKNFQLDINAILDACQKNSVKLIFIPSPNSPMGHMMNLKDILDLSKSLKNKALIIIDEAYIEFSRKKSMTSFIDILPNLVVLRTLSKAYSMAGLRIGSVIGNNQIVQLLKRIQAPYPLTVPSIKAAIQALQPAGIKQINKHIEDIISERDKMVARIETLECIKDLYSSVTNFILFKINKADKLLDYFIKEGIILRSQDYQLTNTIRLSIGTREQNEKVWEMMKKYNVSQ